MMIIFFEKNKNLVKPQRSFLRKIKLIDKGKPISKNLDILELGGGNFFGLFPLFLKNKCKTFTNFDPYIEKDPSKETFLQKILMNKIKKYYKMTRSDFKKYNQISKLNKIKKKKYNMIVSLSCLEHIKDIDKNFKNLRKLTNKNHIQYHIINFSGHIDKSNPFEKLYSNHPKNFIKKYNNNLNFMRISDYKKILKKYRFSFQFKIISTHSVKKNSINSYWKKYLISELQIRTTLLKISGRY